MKKLLVLLTAFLCFLPNLSQASDWFLGGGVQLGTMGRNPGPPSGCIGHSMTIHALIGAEADCGIRGDIWMLYTGFRFGNAYYDRGGGGWESTSKWTRYQLVIGSRLHVPRTYQNPVKPSIGFAVSYGWTQHSTEVDSPIYYEGSGGTYSSHHLSGFSKGGLGAIAEAGIMVELKGPVTPFWMIQIHTFTADFDRDVIYRGDENEPMIEVLFQVGIIYDVSIQ